MLGSSSPRRERESPRSNPTGANLKILRGSFLASLNRYISQKRVDNLLYLVHAQVIAINSNTTAHPTLAQPGLQRAHDGGRGKS